LTHTHIDASFISETPAVMWHVLQQPISAEIGTQCLGLRCVNVMADASVRIRVVNSISPNC